MDINEQFEALVLKYGIDRVYPRFKTRIQARNIIQSLTREYCHKRWILVSDTETDIFYFCTDAGVDQDSVKCYIRGNGQIDFSELKNSLQEEDAVFVVSFYNRGLLMNQLYNCGIIAINIYDYFMSHGLLLNEIYYDIFNEKYKDVKFGRRNDNFDFRDLDIGSIFFYDRRGYECAQTRKCQEFYLARMIFDCAYAKDIEQMNRLIQQYVREQFQDYEQYSTFSEEVSILVRTISENVAKRQQKDVVMFWLDALEYGDDQTMPWLSAQSKRGLEFERAYTVTPYTRATACTLLNGKFNVDDKMFNLKIDDSCSLISNMQQRGYQVKFYTMLNNVAGTIKGGLFQNYYTPLSQICWHFLCDLLKSDKPVFAILHEVFQTHLPCISMGLTGKEYKCPIEGEDGIVVGKDQIEESKQWVDRVLRFYAAMLNDCVYKIYMSDHGNTYLGKFHTIFRVVQEDILPQKINRFFSYISFGKLVEKLLDGDSDYEDILSDYVKVQDTEYYYGKFLKYMIKHHPEQSFIYFGYEGIVTKEGYYLRYNDGREEYYGHKRSEPLTEDWLDRVRSLCPSYPSDIIQDEKFKYSRNLYATLERYLARNQKFEDEKIQNISAIFNEIPENAVIALRGGGIHTYRLWLILPWDVKRRIAFVVDRDPDCIVSTRLGVPAVPIAEINAQGISHIVVSSFEYEKEWLEELHGIEGKFKAIGLYQALAERGVDCKRAFYYKEYSKEDCVWNE